MKSIRRHLGPLRLSAHGIPDDHLFSPLLLQLLLDCGLGGGGGSEGGTEAVVAQHRVLIFCQLKSMLDIVEHDLLKPKLPTVTYLRLDGSVQAGLRHSIVSRSVDCFLQLLFY